MDDSLTRHWGGGCGEASKLEFTWLPKVIHQVLAY